MDELKLLKLAELRSKMGGIPVKLLVTFIFVNLVFWNFSFEKFKEAPGYNIFTFIILYGILSYFWLCVKLTRNWIIGIVVAIALVLVMVGSSMNNSGGVFQLVFSCAICFGGPVLDILTVVRYFIIKKQVFSMPRDTYTYADEPEQDWEQWQENSGQQDQQTQQTRQTQESTPVFFADCKDQAGIKRRYRDLCRVYHPDNGNGSPEVFNRITEEYERLMSQYGQA